MLEIAKVDEPRRVVYGYANVAIHEGESVVDRQGDVIDAADLEIASHEFMQDYRGSGEMHVGKSLGTVVESIVFTEDKLKAMGLPDDVVKALNGRWWIGVQLNERDTFDKVKSGVLKMFSIQGRGERVPVE